MLKTKAHAPAKHPELDSNVPILDIAVWVKEEQLLAPGIIEQNFPLINCIDWACLPMWDPKSDIAREEGEPQSATWLIPQINYYLYSKPSASKTTILSIRANPWQQKRTAFTQEVIIAQTNREF